MKRNKFLEEQLYEGKTLNEVLGSHYTLKEQSAILGISVACVSILKRKKGLCKQQKPSLGILKHKDVTALLNSLVCPRCRENTKNKHDHSVIYCENVLPDGGKCMYHYTIQDYSRAETSRKQAAPCQ